MIRYLVPGGFVPRGSREEEQEMPYKVEERGNKWVVVKEDDGQVMGEHDTKSEAEDQQAAIYANEKDSSASYVLGYRSGFTDAIRDLEGNPLS